MLLPETVGEWTRQNDPVTYDRETIFDYINGAGEVYNSYAFRNVLVDRYETADGRGVTVEVFDMGNVEDAFGVFSYAREDEEEGIGAGFERKGTVLCFWQDRFYVCAQAEQRDDDPAEVLEPVARGISAALPSAGTKPALMGALPENGRVPYSDRFFHTHQALNYQHYLDRENVLKLSPETRVALARYAPGSTYLLVIEYRRSADASSAQESFRAFLTPGSGGPEPALEGRAESFSKYGSTWDLVGTENQFLIAVLDAVSSEAAESLWGAASDNLAGLPLSTP
jgi:hypothetical protein